MAYTMAKIYISSTFTDLMAYRERVYRVLRQTGHDVIAMEDYVATDQRPLQKCLEDVASCNLYIGIFAWRYGYVPIQENPEKKSITELEFRHAKQSGISCLIFLHDEKSGWPPSQMDTGKKLNKVKSLRNKLGNDATVSFFTDIENLAVLVSSAVNNWEKKQSNALIVKKQKNDNIGAIQVLNDFIEQPHWADAAPVRFSLTNLSDNIIKVTQLILVIQERMEIKKTAFKKAGAPVSEFQLFASIGEENELDLLQNLQVQFIINQKNSDAFNLSLAGLEGYIFTCRFEVVMTDLASGKDQKIHSKSFKIQYPIRTLEVLKKRMTQS